MALFMVLFSISSVNISKYQTLQKSLRAAFSGDILPGGKSIAKPGATRQLQPRALERRRPGDRARSPRARRARSQSSTAGSSAPRARHRRRQPAAERQDELFAQIKQRARRLRRRARLQQERPDVDRSPRPGHQGADRRPPVPLRPGDARDPRSGPLLGEIAELLNVDETHPIDVEGNTDNVPIQSAQYPSNWELSTARASTVVRFLIARASPRPADRDRLRRTAPDREQRDRRRARAQPPRGDRPEADHAAETEP